MVAKHAGRGTRRQRRNTANLRKRKDPCWLCGQPIDYDLVSPDPAAFEPDHIYPVSLYPERAEDPANLAASHVRCNRRRGNRSAVVGQLGVTSREW